MKISLITVTFNSSKTLRDTICSVLQQTYLDIEYILIDGMSNDETVDIIKEYEPRFGKRMCWVSEKDNGLYDAMNKGFRMATGDVVGIINSDDLLAESTAIEKVMKTFTDHRQADAVYADLYYVAQTDTSKIIRHWISGKQRPFKYGLSLIHISEPTRRS